MVMKQLIELDFTVASSKPESDQAKQTVTSDVSVERSGLQSNPTGQFAEHVPADSSGSGAVIATATTASVSGVEIRNKPINPVNYDGSSARLETEAVAVPTRSSQAESERVTTDIQPTTTAREPETTFTPLERNDDKKEDKEQSGETNDGSSADLSVESPSIEPIEGSTEQPPATEPIEPAPAEAQPEVFVEEPTQQPPPEPSPDLFSEGDDVVDFTTPIILSDFSTNPQLPDPTSVYYNAAGGNDTVTLPTIAQLDITGYEYTDLGLAGIFTRAFFGGPGNDTITGGDANDTINGDAGNDTIRGGQGDDVLNGGADDDLIEPGPGEDTIDGGTGNNTVTYAAATAGIFASLSDGEAGGGNFTDGFDTFANIQNIIGSEFGDDIDAGSASVGNILQGLGGDDFIFGGPGNDTLLGGAGDDLLDGGADNDILEGGAGNDTLDGGSGADVINAGPSGDIDTLVYGGFDGVNVNIQTNVASGGEAQGDTLIGTFTNLTGGGGDDTLTGNSLNNTINGGNGNDIIFGGAGNDTLDGGFGNDTLNGGAGGDTFIDANGDTTLTYATDIYGVSVNLLTDTTGNAPTATNDSEALGDDISGIALVSTLIGGSAADVLTGDNNNNTIFGGGGNDIISGEGGVDTLFGEAGNDTILGGAGNDVIQGGADNDLIEGGDGADEMRGGAGTDTLSYASSDGGVDIDLVSGIIFTNDAYPSSHADGDTIPDSDFENLTGSNFDDRLTGSDGANVISGLDGDDFINGLAGADTLSGGLGTDRIQYLNDTAGININIGTGTISQLGGDPTRQYALGDTIDTTFEEVDGGEGNDIITGSDIANVLNGNGGDDIIRGLGGDDTINGGSGNDILEGGPGADTFSDVIGVNTLSYESDTTGVTVNLPDSEAFGGDAEGDTFLFANFQNIIGGSGNDDLTGDGLDNTIEGNAGNDTIIGSDGNDTLLGGADNDSLFGGFDNDTLTGGDGDDWLDGGPGADVFSGGAGEDTISYINSTVFESIDLLNLEVDSDPGAEGEGDDISAGGIENIIGGQADGVLIGDFLVGDDNANKIWGEGGKDSIFGNDGDDYLSGGHFDGTDDEVVDILNGGDGNDQLVFGGQNFSGDIFDNDQMHGGAGEADSILFPDGNIFLGGFFGDITGIEIFDLDTLSPTGTNLFLDEYAAEDIFADNGDSNNTIIIEGDANDTVTLNFGFTDQGEVVTGYTNYVDSTGLVDYTFQIDNAIGVTIP